MQNLPPTLPPNFPNRPTCRRTFQALLLASTLSLLAAGHAAAQICDDDSQVFDQGVGGVPDTAEFFDRFGEVLAVGDLDGDGDDDVAIGSPEDGPPGFEEGGHVIVLYGTPDGLSTAGAQHWYLGHMGLSGSPDALDRFGAALAAGDFDGDGDDELAIGVPGESFEAGGAFRLNAGAVYVLYGGPGGLDAAGHAVLRQGVDGLAEQAESFDAFGSALAAGDFDNDGFEDLAMGAPKELLLGAGDAVLTEAGIVVVAYGELGGVGAGGSEAFGAGVTALPFDHFGSSLAAGDFGDDGLDDLAVGSPGRWSDGHPAVGRVTILQGTSSPDPGGGWVFGLTYDGMQHFQEGIGGVPGIRRANDEFGYSLAAADFDRNGSWDLAVGVPGERIVGFELGDPDFLDVGRVRVFFGDDTGGLDVVGNASLSHLSVGEASFSVGQRFGETLTTGDLDHDGFADLVIAAPGRGIGALAEVGVAYLLRGAADGSLTFVQRLEQGPGSGVAENDDRFGSAMAAGDFDGRGGLDLVVGIRDQDHPVSNFDAGSVVVLGGCGLFFDDFESGALDRWSLVGEGP